MCCSLGACPHCSPCLASLCPLHCPPPRSRASERSIPHCLLVLSHPSDPWTLLAIVTLADGDRLTPCPTACSPPPKWGLPRTPMSAPKCPSPGAAVGLALVCPAALQDHTAVLRSQAVGTDTNSTPVTPALFSSFAPGVFHLPLPLPAQLRGRSALLPVSLLRGCGGLSGRAFSPHSLGVRLGTRDEPTPALPALLGLGFHNVVPILCLEALHPVTEGRALGLLQFQPLR